MTVMDFYDVVVFFAIIGTAAGAAAWSAVHGARWFRRDRFARADFVVLAADLWRLHEMWSTAGHPGTVSNRHADPSPTPRNRTHA